MKPKGRWSNPASSTRLTATAAPNRCTNRKRNAGPLQHVRAEKGALATVFLKGPRRGCPDHQNDGDPQTKGQVRAGRGAGGPEGRCESQRLAVRREGRGGADLPVSSCVARPRACADGRAATSGGGPAAAAQHGGRTRTGRHGATAVHAVPIVPATAPPSRPPLDDGIRGCDDGPAQRPGALDRSP